MELHGERLNGVVGLPHQLVEQIVLCESHLQHPGFQSVDAFGLLCRAVPPQHFLNSRQAALSRVAKRRLTLASTAVTSAPALVSNSVTSLQSSFCVAFMISGVIP